MPPADPRCFDGHRNGVLLSVAVLGEQPEQQLIAEAVVGDAPSCQHDADVIHNGDVVMVLGPVDATQHRHDDTPRSGSWRVRGSRWAL